ncbi:Maf family protein [Falsibacillus albus]|uniref:dTTP/UTP pyrophosphatase n=1 Tax=Falsibacillus albus TaxID=2478915 RepID=A0A3L7K4T9_9BACI|nr:Maf family protein [Falsibacillus albus]RLQ98057.1 septum formation inhibitor Maf [Falsibacillus albus]
MNSLILASGSPRRKELLQKLQIPFKVIPSQVDESLPSGISPEDAVIMLAERKAKEVAIHHPSDFVIGSDTIVAYGSQILGKPQGEQEAKITLQLLSNHTHTVYTGVSIFHNHENHSFYEKTDVTFWELKDGEINRYIESGEPFDKAGAYGIQGQGALFVKEIKGDYYAVVGLPISRVYRALMEHGFTF